MEPNIQSAIQAVQPHLPGFLVGLFVALMVWLWFERKALKAELAVLKAAGGAQLKGVAAAAGKVERELAKDLHATGVVIEKDFVKPVVDPVVAEAQKLLADFWPSVPPRRWRLP